MTPKYTITEYDAELMDERVHNREVEYFEDTQYQRDKIQDELNDMR
jgi:hypothetical protein